MKTSFSFFSLLFVASTYSLAQPTITSSVLPSIGMEITHHLYDAVGYTPEPTGANVTWDFSQVVKGQSSAFLYKDPSTVAGNNAYPNANICAVQGDYKVFMTKSASDYLHQGSIYSANSYADYNPNPQELLFFPMTYLDTNSETFTGVVDWGSFMVDRDGTTGIEADAYGTLILPNASISDVLRVKTFDVMEDSINGVWQGRYEYTAYQWFHPNVVDAILTWTIYKSVSSQSTNIDTSGVFKDLTSVGMLSAKEFESRMSIYPNPCESYFNISSPGMDIENVRLEITDMTGRLVYREILTNSTSIHRIDVSGLKSGIYSILLRGDNGTLTERLVVR